MEGASSDGLVHNNSIRVNLVMMVLVDFNAPVTVIPTNIRAGLGGHSFATPQPPVKRIYIDILSVKNL